MFRWHFETDDGTAVDVGPGDVYSIPPDHDACVVGDEPVRMIDWGTPPGNEPGDKGIEAG